MAKTTTDYTKSFQDMMAKFPVDTSAFQEAFKSQTALGEKLTKAALDAAERSTEISAAWAKDSIARIGEAAASKDDPAAYAQAATDLASASAELAREHMSAFAEVAKKLQMDTVDLMLNAGKDIQADVQKAAEKLQKDAETAVKKATAKA